MRGVVECDWGDDIRFDQAERHPSHRWLQEELNPNAPRASASSRSTSWDSSDSSSSSDDDDFPPPSAQPHPSSSRYSSPPRASASPPQLTAPPFSLVHLLKVRTLDTYAKKVLQGAVLDRLKTSKGLARPKARASGSWDRDLEAGLRRGEGKERVDWKGRLNGKERVWKDWRETKRSALVQGALRALIREGEVFVVQDATAGRSRGGGPSTPTPKRTQSSSCPPDPTELYLPTCLPTIGALVLHLIRTETARIRATPAGRKIPGIRAPPTWIPTGTLLRRLAASHERWNWISQPVLEGVLDRMDEGDLIEESTGKGWKIIGS